MKKLVISVLAVMFCLSLSAATSVQVKLVGSNPTYSVSQLTLLEDGTNPAITSGVDAFDASCMMSQSNENSTLIYGMLGGDEYSTVASPDLTGLQIGFKTNEIDQNYTLKFESFSGTAFKIYDLVAGEIITVNGTTPDYVFSVTPAQVPQVAINDRFVINLDVDEGNLETCFTGTELQITNNPYWYGNIVVKTGAGATVKSYPYGTTSIDFNEKSGSYIYSDGTEYTVSFGNGARSFIVKVKR